ncbi:MAG: hypothetical protein P4L51_20030 [Puia sp.]|nr:hypothetical protein [Puia sp.]
MNAKYVLGKAVVAQRENNEMSQAVSVLLLHDAVEIMMIATLDHLNVNVPKNRGFMDFWGLVKQAGLPDAPDKAAMESLNTIRIGLKHKAIVPNSRDVRDLITRTRGFFENVLSLYCSLSYANVSLIDLVPDPSVREMLSEARNKFRDGDKSHAMADLRLAFDKSRQPEGRGLLEISPPRVPDLAPELRTAGWDRYLDQLHKFLQISATITNILMLGVDPVRYFDFNHSVPLIQRTMGKTYTIIYRLDYSNCSEDRFEELMGFVIDYSIKVSDLYSPETTGSPEPATRWERVD